MTDPILIACAMEEEAAPFLDALEGRGTISLPALPESFRGPLQLHSGRLAGQPVIVAMTGIGMTNSALALTFVMSSTKVRLTIFAGTTGGLGRQVRIGDVVAGEAAVYHDADASEFGYEPGQIPRMPARFEADTVLLAHVVESLESSGVPFHRGSVSASNSFVSGQKVEAVRALFPRVLAADMETTAGAQVCWAFAVPWVSLRAVSDLCEPDASQVFQDSANTAYQRSFEAAISVLSALPTGC